MELSGVFIRLNPPAPWPRCLVSSPGQRDLNPQPPALETGALPVELCPKVPGFREPSARELGRNSRGCCPRIVSVVGTATRDGAPDSPKPVLLGASSSVGPGDRSHCTQRDPSPATPIYSESLSHGHFAEYPASSSGIIRNVASVRPPNSCRFSVPAANAPRW